MRIPLTSRSNGMRWPSIEDELLVTCARPVLTEADRETLSELSSGNSIRWDRVYSTARMHGVAPLIYFNLSRDGRTEFGNKNGVTERFRQSFARSLAENRRLNDGLWRILGFFNERRIDAMIVKGAAANLFSNGSGHLTVSQDVDIILRPKPEDVSEEFIEEIHSASRGFPLEFDFYRHHDVDMNGVLDVDFDTVWADAIPVHFRRRDFFIMSPEDSLITACINACRKRYFNPQGTRGIRPIASRGGPHYLGRASKSELDIPDKRRRVCRLGC